MRTLLLSLVALFPLSLFPVGAIDELPTRDLVSRPSSLERVQWKGSFRYKEEQKKDCGIVFHRDGEKSPYAVKDDTRVRKFLESNAGAHVSIQAKRTPKFLFWGNVLIIEHFLPTNPTQGTSSPTKPQN